ncbi:hypothetical protein OAK26_00155 [Gammaproteobacteria bacterium]|jgi:hypothetical protein|nr:hypothetical protein [Gammaproteobacteria bacterium]|tara:strand:- start:70 stop:546 length:477 start_codon:yes stop_codon:yes gene_type:complete
MLTANVGWIFIIQVIISVVILLWSYDRYAKRWGTTLGNHSVEGTYTRVDYVPQDFGGYIVTYGYTVNGKRYFGSIEWSILHFGLLSSIEENIETLKKEYLTGRTVKVFYWEESPNEHSLNIPPSTPFFRAIGIPLLILILSNIPLLFIDYLIVSSPYN